MDSIYASDDDDAPPTPQQQHNSVVKHKRKEDDKGAMDCESDDEESPTRASADDASVSSKASTPSVRADDAEGDESDSDAGDDEDAEGDDNSDSGAEGDDSDVGGDDDDDTEGGGERGVQTDSRCFFHQLNDPEKKVYKELQEMVERNAANVRQREPIKPGEWQMVAAAIMICGTHCCFDPPGLGKTMVILLIAMYESERKYEGDDDEPKRLPALIVSPNDQINRQTMLMAAQMGVSMHEMLVYSSSSKKRNHGTVVDFSEFRIVFTSYPCLSAEFASSAPFYYCPLRRRLVFGISPTEASISRTEAKPGKAKVAVRLRKIREMRNSSFAAMMSDKRSMGSLYQPSASSYDLLSLKKFCFIGFDEGHILARGVPPKTRTGKPSKVSLIRCPKQLFQAARIMALQCANVYIFTGSPFCNTVNDTMVLYAMTKFATKTGYHAKAVAREKTTAGLDGQLLKHGLFLPADPIIEHIGVNIPLDEEEALVASEQRLLLALNAQRQDSVTGNSANIGNSMGELTEMMVHQLFLKQVNKDGVLSENWETSSVVSSVEGAVMKEVVAHFDGNERTGRRTPIIIAVAYIKHIERLQYLVGLYKRKGLLRPGLNVAIFFGDMSPTQKANVLEAFNDGAVDIFILSMECGGAGLNLNGPKPSLLFAGHFPWGAYKLGQTVARVFRLDKEQSVATVKWVYALNTATAWTRRTIEKKVALTQQQFTDIDEPYNFGDKMSSCKDMRFMSTIRGIIREIGRMAEERRRVRQAISEGKSTEYVVEIKSSSGEPAAKRQRVE